MIVVSNKSFWDQLPKTLRKLVPHLQPDDTKAYEKLLRVMQAIIFAKDSNPVVNIIPNTGRIAAFAVSNLSDLKVYTWRNLVGGEQYEVERVQGYSNIEDSYFFVTTENWEASLHFMDDERGFREHNYDDCPYFMRQPIMLDMINIEGDVADFYNSMLLASITVAELERYEVFYSGCPI